MTKNIDNKIIVISGPTASGKTALALDIARLIEQRNIGKSPIIINADSIQIFKELPILSAQPKSAEMREFQHFIFAIFDFWQEISVKIWLDLAISKIKLAFDNDIMPIIVGGSGMYIDKIINGISKIPDITIAVRENVNNKFIELGRDNFAQELLLLEQRLIKENPINKNIHNSDFTNFILNLDSQRLKRRMEVIIQTNKNIDWWHQQEKEIFFDKSYFVHLSLNPDRDILYRNCNQRFNDIFNNGAIEEVERFFTKYENLRDKKKNNDTIIDYKLDNITILNTLGLAEIAGYIGIKNYQKINREEAIELACIKTRNYAKRQLTWFRNQKIEQKFFSSSSDAISFIDKIIVNI